MKRRRCEGKLRLATLRTAVAQIDEHNRKKFRKLCAKCRGSYFLTTYLCDCGFYHVGHLRRRSVRV